MALRPQYLWVVQLYLLLGERMARLLHPREAAVQVETSICAEALQALQPLAAAVLHQAAAVQGDPSQMEVLQPLDGPAAAGWGLG